MSILTNGKSIGHSIKRIVIFRYTQHIRSLIMRCKQLATTEGSLKMIHLYEMLVWPYWLALPFMNISAGYVSFKRTVCNLFDVQLKTNHLLFDGISINGRKVKEGAAQWRALDVVYNFESGEGRNSLERSFDWFWLHMRNAQAVRNRLLVVKRELAKAIEKVASRKDSDEPIKILSLAAGAAQGVIETVQEYISCGYNIQVTLIDRDESALAHARALAKKHGIEKHVTTLIGDVIFFERFLEKDFTPDIIEMCGLLDYLRSSLAIKLIKKIYRFLPKNGSFLTCNAHTNAEAYFLKHVVNWDMLYRSVDEFADLLESSGFSHLKLYTEPHRIHTVAVVSV